MTPPEQIVARTFGISPDQVTDQTSNQTLAEWDSLGHITLVVELESAYGLSLSAEETLKATSVAEIKSLLGARGVTW